VADEPDNLTLRYLRRFDEKLDRVTNVEIVLGTLATAHGQMQQSFDRLSDRIDRTEKRLELTDVPSP
jgi:hypothetical protein